MRTAPGPTTTRRDSGRLADNALADAHLQHPSTVSPPLWVDERGHLRPTRPCPRCRREIPVNRWPVKTLATTKPWPYQVMTFVEWCDHQQEVVLVPEGGLV
jgi:hypothetical protein